MKRKGLRPGESKLKGSRLRDSKLKENKEKDSSFRDLSLKNVKGKSHRGLKPSVWQLREKGDSAKSHSNSSLKK